MDCDGMMRLWNETNVNLFIYCVRILCFVCPSDYSNSLVSAKHFADIKSSWGFSVTVICSKRMWRLVINSVITMQLLMWQLPMSPYWYGYEIDAKDKSVVLKLLDRDFCFVLQWGWKKALNIVSKLTCIPKSDFWGHVCERALRNLCTGYSNDD